MPTFVDDQGTRYEVPDDPNPTEAAQIRQLGLRPEGMSSGMHWLHDQMRSAGSGVAEGLFRTPLIMGDLNKLALMGINKVIPDAIHESDVNKYGSQSTIDAFKDSPQDRWLKKYGINLVYEPQTTSGRYTKAMSSTGAGAAEMGGLSGIPGILPNAARGLTASRIALTPRAALTNTGAGAASELGGDLSRNFDETKPANPIAALAAGLGAGTLGNALINWRVPNLNQTVYNATKDMPESAWTRAQSDLARYRNTGSQSLTLADLPDLQPRMGGVVDRMARTTGGNLMTQKLSTQMRMNTDIPALRQSLEQDLYPRGVDPRGITNDVVTRAASALPLGIPQLPLPASLNGVTSLEGLLSRFRAVPEQTRMFEARMMGMDPDMASRMARASVPKLDVLPNLTDASEQALGNRSVVQGLANYGNPATAGAARDKMEVADALSRLTAHHPSDQTMGLQHSRNPVSKIFAPMSTINLQSGLRMSERQAAQLSDLLGNPTPGNLEKLRQLSKIDPRIEWKLRWLATYAGTGEGSGVTKENP